MCILSFALLMVGCDYNGRTKPNIIMIVADDLGFSDLGCYGGEIKTPNIDKLGYEGIRFTQFYNGAVCFVSRASMLTGVFTRKEEEGFLKQNMVTIGEVLQDNEYFTILSGKWHLGEGKYSPNNRGFQEFYGSIAGAINYFDPSLPTNPPFLEHYHSAEQPFVHNGKVIDGVPPDYYSTDAITDHAISQITKSVNKDNPFFLHLAYNAPHYPLQALPEDIEKYKGHYDEGYTFHREKRYKNLVQLGIISPDWVLPVVDEGGDGELNYDRPVIPWNMIEDRDYEANKMEVYSAMVDRMDQNIGRLLNTIEQLGVDDNTLVLFFSDNGGCASLPRVERMEEYYQFNKGNEIGSKSSYEFCGPGWATVQSSPFRRYKVWTYEGGISTPMIAYWKGKIKPGIVTREVGHLVDILPTVLDITGIEYPSEYHGNKLLPLDGKSLFPTFISDDEYIGEERELGWYLYGNRAYRKGNWKIVWGINKQRWELYDMKRDRTEINDLSLKHPEIVNKLSEKWWVWVEQCNFQREEIERW
ncbi:arylsulfatase [Membranihabitans maritimus]|uniref:arylsulfatase n=1 Tax=Membranihabitans maritimus TaxID=2904244 RepID=UPI001F47468E|nr:arylsulfatase [Membranihabitans maritimus]